MRLLVCLFVVLFASLASAQGLDITRGQRGLVRTYIPVHKYVSTAVAADLAGDVGTVASFDYTGKSAGVTQGTITLTRTGTNAVAPPPYAARIQFAVYDNGGNSVITCSGATIQGLNEFGEGISETLSGTIDETPATSPVLTSRAYSDVSKVTLTGCTGTGTFSGDIIKAVVSDWIYVGQSIRGASSVLKVCTQDYDSSIANAWQCYSGKAINTEKTWSSIFHTRSNTIDVATLFSSDTQLFSGADDSILIETFPFPVSQ